MSVEISEDFFDPKSTTYTPYTELSDERLAELAKSGDSAAIEELVNRSVKSKESK